MQRGIIIRQAAPLAHSLTHAQPNPTAHAGRCPPLRQAQEVQHAQDDSAWCGDTTTQDEAPKPCEAAARCSGD